MATNETAQEHLQWCVDRAMQYYDAGDRQNAIASFLSGVGKHPQTEWIQGHPLALAMLTGAAERGPDEFRRALDWIAGLWSHDS